MLTPKKHTVNDHQFTGHGRRRTPETLTLLSYLQPITSLDECSIETLEKLLKFAVDFRKATFQTSRIQRGSPNAHALGSTISNFRPRITNILEDIKQVFAENRYFPGMYLLQAQFDAFQETFNQSFNDGGNEAGYSERVRLLEKLMYLNGTLRGHIEVVLEQHSYWKARLAGQIPPKAVRRRLNFNQEADVLQTSTQPMIPSFQQANLPTSFFGGIQPPQLGLQFGSQSGLQRAAPTLVSPESKEPDQDTVTVKLNLCDHLKSSVTCLWESKNHTDVTFLVCGERVSAHRVILASQSEYFDRLLYGDMKESHQDEIELQDVSSLQAFQLLIKYAYTGCLTIENGVLQDVLDVLEMCDRFGFVLAKMALSEQLASKVTLSNVLQLLIFADLYEASSLVNKCFKIIDENGAHVLASDGLLSLPPHNLKSVLSRDTLQVPEVLVFDAVYRWIDHNKSNGDFTDVLSCVRLSEISVEELFNKIESSHLFKQEDIMNALRIQIKPDLEQMNPRGQKSMGRNLFLSATPANRTQSLFSYLQPRSRCQPPSIVNGVVRLVPLQSSSGTGPMPQNLGGYTANQQQSVVTVMLNGCYLVNNLEFCGFPQSNKYSPALALTDLKTISVFEPPQLPGSQPEAFSYIIRVSKDQKKWLTLFNYTDYSCLGCQVLQFPVQAVRYVQFELQKCATQGFEVQFKSCAFVESTNKFKLRPNGVIAPQYLYNLRAHQCELTADQVADCANLPSGKRRLLVIFQQPVSISNLRFTLKGPGHTKVSIVVLASAKNDIKHFQEIGTQDDIEIAGRLPLWRPVVQLHFKEREVVYVIVVITKETTVTTANNKANLIPRTDHSRSSTQTTAATAKLDSKQPAVTNEAVINPSTCTMTQTTVAQPLPGNQPTANQGYRLPQAASQTQPVPTLGQQQPVMSRGAQGAGGLAPFNFGLSQVALHPLLLSPNPTRTSAGAFISTTVQSKPNLILPYQIVSLQCCSDDANIMS